MTPLRTKGERTMTYEGRQIDEERLAIAARELLEKIANMTTGEFNRGADRQERRNLAIALGLKPENYSL